MISTNEDALVCDFAEYYHIYDYRALPVNLTATLACGLRDHSRIKQVLSNTGYSTDTLLLAAAVDRLSLLWWSKTKDGQNGTNMPASILVAMQKTDTQSDDDICVYESGESFHSARKRLIEGR